MKNEWIDDTEIEMNAEFIFDTLLTPVRTVRPKSDTPSATLVDIDNTLEQLGINYQEAQSYVGEKAYANNFDNALIAYALRTHGAHPTNLFSEHNDRERQALEILIKHPDLLHQMRTTWNLQVIRRGVQTYPDFANLTNIMLAGNQANIDNIPDIYSTPNRYPNLFDYLKTHADSSEYQNNHLFEIGSCLGDNLIALRPAYPGICLGLDKYNMFELSQHPTMEKYRWQASGVQRSLHQKSLHDNRIIFMQADLFSRDFNPSRILKVLKSDSIEPHLTVMCLNVLFPHYSPQKLREGLEIILSWYPNRLIIGGGLPGIEQCIDGKWTLGRHSYVFNFNNLVDITLEKHIVDGAPKI